MTLHLGQFVKIVELGFQQLRNRSRAKGDRRTDVVAFKQPFPRLEGTNSCTHFKRSRGQHFGGGNARGLRQVSPYCPGKHPQALYAKIASHDTIQHCDYDEK